MLELSGVRKSYRGRTRPVLDGVDLRADAADVLVVTGEAGQGKTTLIELLCGAAVADAGQVSVFGRDVGRLRSSSIALLRRHLGILRQETQLLEDRTALDNVAVPLEVTAAPRRDARARAAGVLADFELAEELDVRVDRLSAGQRRRVALCRALVTDAPILLLDEPTAHLDARGWELLLSALAARQAEGAIAVVAGADPRLPAAAAMCGWRLVELRAGAAVELGGPVAQPEDYPELEVTIDELEEDTAPNVVPFPVAARAGGAE